MGSCYFPVIILSAESPEYWLKWEECVPPRRRPPVPALSPLLNAVFVLNCVFHKPKTLALLKEGSCGIRAGARVRARGYLIESELTCWKRKLPERTCWMRW